MKKECSSCKKLKRVFELRRSKNDEVHCLKCIRSFKGIDSSNRYYGLCDICRKVKKNMKTCTFSYKYCHGGYTKCLDCINERDDLCMDCGNSIEKKYERCYHCNKKNKKEQYSEYMFSD